MPAAGVLPKRRGGLENVVSLTFARISSWLGSFGAGIAFAMATKHRQKQKRVRNCLVCSCESIFLWFYVDDSIAGKNWLLDWILWQRKLDGLKLVCRILPYIGTFMDNAKTTHAHISDFFYLLGGNQLNFPPSSPYIVSHSSSPPACSLSRSLARSLDSQEGGLSGTTPSLLFASLFLRLCDCLSFS